MEKKKIPTWLKRVFTHPDRYNKSLNQQKKRFQHRYQRPIQTKTRQPGASYDYEYAADTNGYSYGDYYDGSTMNSQFTDGNDHHHSHHDAGNICDNNGTCDTGGNNCGDGGGGSSCGGGGSSCGGGGSSCGGGGSSCGGGGGSSCGGGGSSCGGGGSSCGGGGSSCGGGG